MVVLKPLMLFVKASFLFFIGLQGDCRVLSDSDKMEGFDLPLPPADTEEEKEKLKVIDESSLEPVYPWINIQEIQKEILEEFLREKEKVKKS